MSERTHSDTPNHSRYKLIPWAAGTLVAVVMAAVAFQVYHAEPGAAQQRDAQTAGNVKLESTASTDDIVARVNGEPITQTMVAQECFERYGAEVLDNIVNRRIIEQECQRAGVQITTTEIEKEVLTIATKFNIDQENWYAMLKAERGISRPQYHRDVIFPMLALKKLAGQNISITDQDLQKAFVKHFGPRVECRMILVQGNVRQAGEIWQKAKANPAEFGHLAQEVSADPNTRPLGGVIPPIQRYGGNDKIEEEAFRLKVGDVSPVIDIGENRYVILKCEGHTKPVTNNIEDVRAQLHEQLLEEKTQEAVAKVFEGIKTRSTVVNYLTRTSTGAQSAAAPAQAGPRAAMASPATAVR
ncbi:MAG: peptidylprolyl isomerase [Planctomycetaceae bacterium]